MNKKYIFYVIVSAFMASSVPMDAQTEDCACCSSQYNKFDFWIGDWTVKNKKGEVVGMSKIQKMENNCLVSEEWSGNNKFSGRSYNYFDPERETWNQLWISNTGNILRLEGRLVENKMVLTSPLQSGLKGFYKNQIIWTPRQNGTVIQEWFLLHEGKNKKDTLFFGVYHRKE